MEHIKLQVTIIHAPRPDRVELTKKQLQQMLADADYEWRNRIRIVSDTEKIGYLRNTWRAVLVTDPVEYTHHMIMHDDLEVSQHFLETVERLLAVFPDQPYNFFPPPRAFFRDRYAAGDSWAKTGNGVWAPCYAWPTTMWREFWRWKQAYLRPDATGYSEDMLYSAFFRAKKYKAVVPLPGLVQHVGVESVIGNAFTLGTGLVRETQCWIGRDVDPRLVQWRTDHKVREEGWKPLHEFKDWFLEGAISE